MRMIGSIPRDNDAERFSDYLLSQRIENMVEESANGHWSVWVEKDDDLERARSELDRFLANSADQRYDGSGVAAKKRREEEQAKRKKKRAQYIDVRTRWGQPKQWAAPLTLALIVLSCLVSVGTKSVMGARNTNYTLLDPLFFTSCDQERVTQWLKAHPNVKGELEALTLYWFDHMKRGQIWRIFTPMLIHWHILHLLFNMFWLRDLGGMIEIQQSTRRLALLVVLCEALSGFGEYYWSGISMFGGMSGVNYGLFAYIWVKQRYEPHLGLGISPQATMILMGWLIICMLGIMGDVANAAHVVGLLSGAAIAFVPYQLRRKMRTRGL